MARIHEIAILLAKGLAGGTLVVLFALISEGISPKRFAGLFSAAPAVAIAGLTIVLLDKARRCSSPPSPALRSSSPVCLHGRAPRGGGL